MLRIIIALIVAIFLMPSLGFGADTYYCDCTAGVNGDGGVATPFNSIANTEAVADDGDTVHVTAGPCTVATASFSDDIIWISDTPGVVLSSNHDSQACYVNGLTTSMTLRGFRIEREEKDDLTDYRYGLTITGGTLVLDNTWVTDNDTEAGTNYYFYTQGSSNITVINTAMSINSGNAAHTTIAFHTATTATVTMTDADNTMTFGTTGNNHLFDRVAGGHLL